MVVKVVNVHFRGAPPYSRYTIYFRETVTYFLQITSLCVHLCVMRCLTGSVCSQPFTYLFAALLVLRVPWWSLVLCTLLTSLSLVKYIAVCNGTVFIMFETIVKAAVLEVAAENPLLGFFWHYRWRWIACGLSFFWPLKRPDCRSGTLSCGGPA